jgi:hypothetical protein
MMGRALDIAKRVVGISFYTLMLVSTSTAFAATVPIQIIPKYNMSKYDAVIKQLYQHPASHADSIAARVAFDSAFFMGKPYQKFPLGEGPNADFDKNPLYRTDAFDCMTYVNTVIALANANNLQEFQRVFKLLSYENGQVAFVARNHFVTGDWNENNAKSGYIKDITASIKNTNGLSPVRYAVTTIDRPNWYRMMLPDRVRVFSYPGDEQAAQLLNALRAQASTVKAQRVATPYIPISALYDAAGQPNMQLFNQIPSGAIIEIVRPNWDLTRYIGTHINVSHLGFVFRTPQGLVFREASLDSNRITDLSLTTYLRQFIGTSVGGINVEQVF